MNLFIAHIQDNNALISGDEAHHLKKVLRKNVGDRVLVTNGEGILAEGTISSIQSKETLVTDLKFLNNHQKRNYEIYIAIAPTKQIDRTEFFLEKAVELGLDGIYPVITFHSERRKINADRLERIAVAAMKQSLKAEIPQVFDLMDLNDFLEKTKDFDGQKLIAHCHEDIARISLKNTLSPNGKYLFLIGPEGDFDENEIKKVMQHGFESISLGRQRLRTETAALACVSAAHWLHL